MKTINTVLPVYDTIIKKCHQRATRLNPNNIESHAVVTPRFRLPSMQWNVESDDPGVITRIELLDENGTQAVNTKGFAQWGTYHPWYNVSFATFDVEYRGLDIVSAIIVAAGGAYGNMQYFHGVTGEVITIRGTLTHNSGVVPFLTLYGPSGLVSIKTLTAGVGSYSWTIPVSGMYYIRITGGSPADGSNFSFTSVSFETGNFLNHFWDGVRHITSMSNVTYDTFTPTPAVFQNVNYTVVKTTAAGEATSLMTGPVSASAGERIRFDVYITLNSGTAPKVELRDTTTGAITRSNTVQLVAGRNTFVLTPTGSNAGNNTVYLFNGDGESTNFTINFAEGMVGVYEPTLFSDLTDEYFQYKGETLGILLPTGIYSLKIYTANGYVYYSDDFLVDCVFDNLISTFTNAGYETFSSSGTTILRAISTAGADYAITEPFEVKKGESIRVILNLNLSSGTMPFAYLINQGWTLQDAEQLSEGLNEVTLTATWSGTAYIIVYNESAACDFLTSEILVIREYSENYLTINFSNTCDLGDILYQDGFSQTLYFKSETMEPSFPLDEEGQKNGEGRFVRTFGRQVKKYTARTLAMPDYMVDVFNRMKLHDTVEMIDLVGDVNDIHNLEVDHEWLFDDKYYAKIDLTFDYDEAFVVSACCVNFT